MFGMHYKDYFRNLKWLKKERHIFKSGEKYFISLENKKRYLSGRSLSSAQLLLYRKKLRERLKRERRWFLLKMLLGVLILSGIFYGILLINK